VQLINRERAVVVDVSESDEFAAGHIVGSRNVPVGQLQQRLPEVVKNKGVPLILVCASGTRAQRCLGPAKSLGYDKAVVLGGGLRAWKAANLPVERS
jgi:rhodanese-related sulfurtransferase